MVLRFHHFLILGQILSYMFVDFINKYICLAHEIIKSVFTKKLKPCGILMMSVPTIVLTHITGIWVEHCCNWVLLIASWFFSWAFVEFETSKQYPVVRAKDLFLNHGIFICSSVTKDQFNYYNCSILVWFGDVLDILIRKSSWHI